MQITENVPNSETLEVGNVENGDSGIKTAAAGGQILQPGRRM